MRSALLRVTVVQQKEKADYYCSMIDEERRKRKEGMGMVFLPKGRGEGRL